MAAPTGDELLKSIRAFAAEHIHDRNYTNVIGDIQRVAQELAHDAPGAGDSPGRQAAKQAGAKANEPPKGGPHNPNDVNAQPPGGQFQPGKPQNGSTQKPATGPKDTTPQAESGQKPRSFSGAKAEALRRFQKK